jgi:hypothetical protein
MRENRRFKRPAESDSEFSVHARNAEMINGVLTTEEKESWQERGSWNTASKFRKISQVTNEVINQLIREVGIGNLGWCQFGQDKRKIDSHSNGRGWGLKKNRRLWTNESGDNRTLGIRVAKLQYDDFGISREWSGFPINGFHHIIGLVPTNKETLLIHKYWKQNFRIQSERKLSTKAHRSLVISQVLSKICGQSEGQGLAFHIHHKFFTFFFIFPLLLNDVSNWITCQTLESTNLSRWSFTVLPAQITSRDATYTTSFEWLRTVMHFEQNAFIEFELSEFFPIQNLTDPNAFDNLFKNTSQGSSGYFRFSHILSS